MGWGGGGEAATPGRGKTLRSTAFLITGHNCIAIVFLCFAYCLVGLVCSEPLVAAPVYQGDELPRARDVYLCTCGKRAAFSAYVKKHKFPVTLELLLLFSDGISVVEVVSQSFGSANVRKQSQRVLT